MLATGAAEEVSESSVGAGEEAEAGTDRWKGADVVGGDDVDASTSPRRSVKPSLDPTRGDRSLELISVPSVLPMLSRCVAGADDGELRRGEIEAGEERWSLEVSVVVFKLCRKPFSWSLRY